MATQDPAGDIVTFLGAAGLGLSSGTNLFEGEIRPVENSIPAKAVFVKNTGGPAPSPYFGDLTSFYRGRVQVIIRGDAGNNQAGDLLARKVCFGLHLAGISGYIAVYSLNSLPEYMGVDASQRGLWVVLIEAQWKG